MKRNYFVLLVVALIILAIGCQKKNEIVTSGPKKSTVSVVKDSSVISFFKSLGFKTNNIVEKDSIYIAEGDISFNKVYVLNQIKKGKTTDEVGRHSYQSLISQNRTNIYVRVAPNIITFANYDNAVREAIRQWNSVTNCRVNLIYTPAGVNMPIDITIQAGDLGTGLCGQGSWPTSGLAGSTVTIDLDETLSLSFPQLIFLLIHEIGHNLGLRHSDITNPPNNVIPGTPVFDANSVMRSATCGFTFVALTQADIDAVRFMYPANSPTLVTQISGPSFAPAFSTLTHISGAFYPCNNYEWRLLNSDEQLLANFTNNCAELTWSGYPSGEYYLECRLTNPENNASTPWNRYYVNLE